MASDTVQSAPDQKIASEIAVEAYVYLYPLVLMERTRRQMTNVERPGDVLGRGPVDTFAHFREYPPASFKDVVKPNFDTLYSPAWLDLREEPRIVSLPATDLYYLMPVYDMWSDIFACPGTRTNGAVAGDYAICGPDWEGELPEGVVRVDAPTPWAWLIVRTKASPATYAEVNAFQDELRITRLGEWPGPADAVLGTVDPAVDANTPPVRQVFALGAADFFGEAMEILREIPTHIADGPILERMARIGLVPGEGFDLGAAAPEAAAALEAAAPAAIAKITERQRTLVAPVNGWIAVTESIGSWGVDYLRRACIDLIGLGANLPEDAVYPISYFDGDGDPYDGGRSYALHFDANALPPVKAFWSLTMYDEDGFAVDNPLGRFAIGDRDDLTFNPDGSLDLQIGAAEPAAGSSNWLPAPGGSFNLCLRLYYPEASVLDGSWTPPAVLKS
ncbi:MAG TPA: DUF1254 domain-containing protein [Solirubrobacterales bacterium]|nr:DUF1254 domain-containing protein [Solirubrobacterales bacterium]